MGQESGITEEGILVDTDTVPEGRKHSVWMSDIYSRLLCARNLLTDDGIILISINDKEVAHLKKICEEVFYPENFIAQFVWMTDGNFDNQAKVKTCHEYILLYAKDATLFDYPNLVDPNTNDKSKLNNQFIRNTIVKNGPKNPVQSVTLREGFPAEIESAVFKAQQGHWPFHNEDIIVENYKVVKNVEVRSGWAARAQLDEFMQDGNDWKPVKDTKGQDCKFVLTSTGGIDCIKDRGIKSHVISVLQNMGGTQSATSELEELKIYGFGYPKPTQLIEYLLKLHNSKDCIVLDFYAGSGTTGHAVTKLNFADSGSRKYILVQFPATLSENNKAREYGYKKISDLTIARNKAVTEKIRKSFEGKIITPRRSAAVRPIGIQGLYA